MHGPIYQYLADDHRRLEDALLQATRVAGTIDPGAYGEFRAGLLRHISMEEKILLPAAARAGSPIPVAARLRLDHGALAALLVPVPSAPIIGAIRTVLEAHNPVEEGVGGVYDQCEQAIGAETPEVLARLQNAPAVALAGNVENPAVVEFARKALERAGYHLDLSA